MYWIQGGQLPIHLLASIRIRKLLVVSEQAALIPGILFQILVVLQALEHDLAEAVIVGHICHLVIVQLAHELPSRLRRVHDCPALDSMLGHEVLRQRGGHFRHMSAIVLLAHAGLAVAENRQTQVLAWREAFASLFLESHLRVVKDNSW